MAKFNVSVRQTPHVFSDSPGISITINQFKCCSCLYLLPHTKGSSNTGKTSFLMIFESFFLFQIPLVFLQRFFATSQLSMAIENFHALCKLDLSSEAIYSLVLKFLALSVSFGFC